MRSEEIKQLIESKLIGSDACVEGDGTHFSTLVISAQFDGKSRIERQQMIYDTVRKQLLDGSLHALSIKALTPSEWDKVNV